MESVYLNINDNHITICYKLYNYKDSLKNHIHIQTDYIFVCERKECGKKFSNIYKYLSNYHIHTGEIVFIYIQDKCENKFFHKREFIKYIRVHTVKIPYVCIQDECGKRYSQKYQLT